MPRGKHAPRCPHCNKFAKSRGGTWICEECDWIEDFGVAGESVYKKVYGDDRPRDFLAGGRMIHKVLDE